MRRAFPKFSGHPVATPDGILPNTVKIHGAIMILVISLTGYTQQSPPELPAVGQVVDQFFDSVNSNYRALLACLLIEVAQVLNMREEDAGQSAFVSRPGSRPTTLLRRFG